MRYDIFVSSPLVRGKRIVYNIRVSSGEDSVDVNLSTTLPQGINPSEDILLLNSYSPLFLSCFLAGFSTIGNSPTTVHFPYKLSQPSIDALDKLILTIQRTNAYLLGEKNPPNIKVKWKSSIFDNKSIVKNEVNLTRAICSMSGGKDSLLTYKLLEDIGLSPTPVMIRWSTLAFSLGMKKYLDILPKHGFSEITTILSTFNRSLPLFNFIKAQKGLSIPSREYFLLRQPVFGFVQSSLLSLIAYQEKVKYVLLGDEDPGHIMAYGEKIPELGTLGQYSWCYDVINVLNKEHGINQELGSIVASITEFMEILLIDKYYEESCGCFSSCVTQINRWCHACNKCLRIWFIMSILGIDSSKYGLNGDIIKQKHPAFKGKYKDDFYLTDDEFEKYRNLILNPEKLEYLNDEDGFELVPKDLQKKVKRLINKFCKEQGIKERLPYKKESKDE